MKKTKDVKKYLLYGLALLILFLLNRNIVLMLFFITTTFLGKIMRSKISIDIIVFEPQLFYALLILKFWGIKELVIFLACTVLVGDAVASNLTDGSFLNYVLFHITPLISYFIFKENLILYGLFATLLYAITYIPLKVKFLGGDPIQATSKAFTPVLFVFLYMNIFGGLFRIIM